MKIGIMKKGDHIISVTAEFIAVERKNGEVDVLPLIKDETGIRVDISNIVTVGYGNNTVETLNDNIVVTTF